MKNVFCLAFLLSFLILSACNKNDSGSPTPQEVAERQQKTNVQWLKSGQWCALEDSDGDGKIGVFAFDDQEVHWTGWDLRKKSSYGSFKQEWSLQGNFLQFGKDIGSSEGYTLSFEALNNETIMIWTVVSKDRKANGLVSFRGHLCQI